MRGIFEGMKVMRKILSLVLSGIMSIMSMGVYATDISSGVFGTEYLENAKALEFTWDITESSYWEIYVYNHGAEALTVEVNKGSRNIFMKEILSKQTATIYGEGKFDKGVYTIKAVSSGTENLCGKLSYQITDNVDNLQRKIPENLTDMSGLSGIAGASKNEIATILRPIEIGNVKPVVEKDIPNDNIFILKASPETEAINELFDYGIMKGDPDGNLRLGDAVTRAEAVTMLIRASAKYNDILKDYLYRPVFDDIENHWAEKEISFAYENGLIDGTSTTTFEPERNVTVQEFAKMLVTILGYKERAERRGGFPHGYMVTANSLGLTENLNRATTQNAIRSDVALMISNSLDVPLMKQSVFGDDVKYTVMDGKNGVALETFRTILDSKRFDLNK